MKFGRFKGYTRPTTFRAAKIQKEVYTTRSREHAYPPKTELPAPPTASYTRQGILAYPYPGNDAYNAACSSHLGGYDACEKLAAKHNPSHDRRLLGRYGIQEKYVQECRKLSEGNLSAEGKQVLKHLRGGMEFMDEAT